MLAIFTLVGTKVIQLGRLILKQLKKIYSSNFQEQERLITSQNISTIDFFFQKNVN